jgi:hypothetical protein
MVLNLAFAPREGRPPESLKQEHEHRHFVPAKGDIVAVNRFFECSDQVAQNGLGIH